MSFYLPLSQRGIKGDFDKAINFINPSPTLPFRKGESCVFSKSLDDRRGEYEKYDRQNRGRQNGRRKQKTGFVGFELFHDIPLRD